VSMPLSELVSMPLSELVSMPLSKLVSMPLSEPVAIELQEQLTVTYDVKGHSNSSQHDGIGLVLLLCSACHAARVAAIAGKPVLKR
jgi:hypothetical protein